jgi:hypothetical protein
MSISKRLFLGVASLVLSAAVASASSFRAADIVYLPAVARAPGAGGSFFKTDVTIANLSTARVVVTVAYLPTGGADNTAALSSLKTLATFAAGERRELTDIVETLQLGAVDPADGVRKANGYLIFFACRENGDCTACDTKPADCLNISVQGRIYNETSAGTFGQSFPGIPWYSYVSMTSGDRGFDKVSINGIRNTGAPGQSGFRSNIGLVNASQFSTTTLRVSLFSNTGTLIGTKDVALGPLGHSQFSVAQNFTSFTGDGFAVVEQISASPVPGVTDANPGFMAYGSLLDNRTSDPTTLEAQFNVVLPFDCIYGSKAQKRQVRRP